jgi:hypothetical protein
MTSSDPDDGRHEFLVTSESDGDVTLNENPPPMTSDPNEGETLKSSDGEASEEPSGETLNSPHPERRVPR